VHFVIGDKWEDAIIVMQALGLAAGIDQLGFNWTAFMRALGITRPMAILSVFDFFVFLGVTTPLLVIFGLPGFAAGVLVAEAVRLTARSYYLKRLFPQLAVVRYFVRAITPVLPAVFIVLGARLLETGDRTPALAAAELTAFVLAAIGATLVLERRLLRESLGYLKRKAPKPAGASLTSPAR
jgi:O-antigen/teichoic acid export membrane protein